MRQYSIIKTLPTAMMIIVAVIAFIGCEKKTEHQQTDIKTEVDAPDTVSPLIEPVTGETIEIPDLKGTWTGTFDKRTTTLTITEQTDSNFSGNLSIKYRETIKQNVKGSFSPSTFKVSMEDQIHSKFMGKYNGKFSDDFKMFSGTFTKNRDGVTTSFTLNKK
jgi:hypothetical protein